MTPNASATSGGLTSAQLERLQGLSSCVIASAIEHCGVRLPNTGFSNSSIRCIFEDLSPVAGYAVTVRIRTASPPMEGGRYSYSRTDWWEHVFSVPAPRILVIEDTDEKPGLGAFVGEVHANILRSLQCVGLATNGAVRDLREVRVTGLQMFAGNVSLSHAYAHVYDFGGPVNVAGLRVRPGDFLHGDMHGIQTVPLNIVDQILIAADDILQRRHLLAELCRSGCSAETIRQAVKDQLQPAAESKTRRNVP
jgi:regulator of RNase E activity RraA